MHKLCVEYAYAYLGISIHDYPYVHIGTGNSCPDMDEHRLLHDRFMLGMYKDEYLKNNQILNTMTSIFGYHPNSYPKFLIYLSNIGLNFRLV